MWSDRDIAHKGGRCGGIFQLIVATGWTLWDETARETSCIQAGDIKIAVTCVCIEHLSSHDVLATRSDVMNGFSGKTALVTGGTSGIGRATVLALAKAGANVVFTGRRRPEGEQVAEEAKRAGAAHGVKVQFVAGDVTDEKHVEHAVRTGEAITGKLDFALNNAGLEWGGFRLPKRMLRIFTRFLMSTCWAYCCQ